MEAVWERGVVEAVWERGVVEEAVWERGVVEEAVWERGVVEEAVWERGVVEMVEAETVEAGWMDLLGSVCRCICDRFHLLPSDGGVSKSLKHSLYMNHHPQRHADLGEEDLVLFFLSSSSNASCSLRCLTSSSWNSAQCDTCIGGTGRATTQERTFFIQT